MGLDDEQNLSLFLLHSELQGVKEDHELQLWEEPGKEIKIILKSLYQN